MLIALLTKKKKIERATLPALVHNAIASHLLPYSPPLPNNNKFIVPHKSQGVRLSL